MVSVEAVASELGRQAGQVVVYIDAAARGRFHPDQAVPLDGGQLPQAVLGALDTVEVLGMGNADQRPIQVVGPGMVGAFEMLTNVAAAVGDTRSTVPADVDEGLEDAVLVAHHQDGNAGVVVGEVVAGVGDAAGQAHQQR